MAVLSQGWAGVYGWWDFKSVSKILLGKTVESSFKKVVVLGALCINVESFYCV